MLPRICGNDAGAGQGVKGKKVRWWKVTEDELSLR